MLNELLVPRKKIAFDPVGEGRFIPLADNVPDILQAPMIRKKEGLYVGYESGYRSGLLKINDDLYRIKGCRPENGKYGNEPKGSQLLRVAEHEVKSTRKRREYFLSAGLEYPSEPVGIWVYDHHQFQGQETAATIYKVKGDTRLDELVWHFEKAPLAYFHDYKDAVMSMIHQLGVRSGDALKTFHQGNFAWDRSISRDTLNAHYGNVVVFPGSESSTQIGMVDFDNSIKSDDPSFLNELQQIQAADLVYFMGFTGLKRTTTFSTPRYRYSKYCSASGIVEDMISKIPWEGDVDAPATAAGEILIALDTSEAVELRKELGFGVEAGYMQDKGVKQQIRWDDFKEAVGQIQTLRRLFKKEVLSVTDGKITQEVIEDLALRASSYFSFLGS